MAVLDGQRPSVPSMVDWTNGHRRYSVGAELEVREADVFLEALRDRCRSRSTDLEQTTAAPVQIR